MKLADARAAMEESRTRFKNHLAECSKCGRYTFCPAGARFRMHLADQETEVKLAVRREQYLNGERKRAW